VFSQDRDVNAVKDNGFLSHV